MLILVTPRHVDVLVLASLLRVLLPCVVTLHVLSAWLLSSASLSESASAWVFQLHSPSLSISVVQPHFLNLFLPRCFSFSLSIYIYISLSLSLSLFGRHTFMRLHMHYVFFYPLSSSGDAKGRRLEGRVPSIV